MIMRRMDGGGRLSRRVHKPVSSTAAPDPDPPAGLSGLVAWYRADLGVTLVVDKMSTWADQKSPAQNLTQGTDANRPTWLSTPTRFGGESYLSFDGTADHLVASTAADWGFLHDGTGMTMLAVFELGPLGASRRLFDTNNGSSTALGFSMGIGAAGALAIQIGNGTTNVVTAAPAATHTENERIGLIFRHATSATPDWDMNVTGFATTGNNTNAPVAGAPGSALNVGRTSGGAQFFNGYLVELAFYNRSIGDSEVTDLQNYAIPRYF